ncbi:hypothetical protein PVAP13_8KG280701 [Panicum virgatum]|uniref:Uncharacterized protein n=1 Tax=Panicum virgatum TaxID=38727 RepID=A0A8T0PK03_PANVG|nr:hypothetical protein PVAP13_8KG280701 [Panicum virgatum]
MPLLRALSQNENRLPSSAMVAGYEEHSHTRDFTFSTAYPFLRDKYPFVKRSRLHYDMLKNGEVSDQEEVCIDPGSLVKSQVIC